MAIRFPAFLTVGFAAHVLAGAALADSPASFAGRTINLEIGYSTGGGYDVYVVEMKGLRSEK